MHGHRTGAEDEGWVQERAADVSIIPAVINGRIRHGIVLRQGVVEAVGHRRNADAHV